MPKILITDESLSFENEISFELALKIIAAIKVGNEDEKEEGVSNSSLTQIPQNPEMGFSQYTSPSLSPQEELLSYPEAKFNPDKVLILGNYFQKVNSQDNFSPSDIKDLFIKAGEKDPTKNLARDFKHTVKLGYISQLGNSNKYYVTRTGLSVLSSNFANRPKGGFSVGTNKTKKKKQILTAGLESLEVMSELEGFPRFHHLAKRSDKILWLLIYAEAKGNIKSLTATDIEYLSDKLKDSISTSNFTSGNISNIKSTYVKQKGNGYSILQKGIDYLKNQLKSMNEKGGVAERPNALE